MLLGIAEGDGEGIPLGPAVGAPDFPLFDPDPEPDPDPDPHVPASNAELLGMSAASRRSERAAVHELEREPEPEPEPDLPDLPVGIADGAIEGEGEGIPLGPAVGASDFPLLDPDPEPEPEL